jgi:hypothetical protein
MSQKPLNPQGGEASYIAGRLPLEQAAWFDAIQRQLGGTRSDVLRSVVALAQKHEEELLEAQKHEEELLEAS